MAGYIGSIPVPQATQTREAFTATSNQVTFNTGGYTAGFVDVYMNGVKLAAADFTATNGSDIVLASGAAANDIVEVVAYTAFEVLNQNFTGTTTVEALTATGAISGTSADFDGGVTIDNITIDGAEIDLSSGNLLLDVAGDIYLDADGGDVVLFDGGTEFGRFEQNSNNLRIKSSVSDGDILFMGSDNGSAVTALTLDMSDAGTAIFNNNVGIGVTPFAKLNVYGSNNSNVMVVDAQGTAPNYIFDVRDDGTSKFRVDGSGNVGIGTSNPIADLSIVDASTGTGMEFQAEVDTGTNRLTNYDRVESAYKKFRLDASEQQFYISGSEKLRIGSSGEMQLGGTTNSGFIDFDSSSLQLNTQRNPNTGAFQNTGRAHTSIVLSDGNGTASNSYIRFMTSSSNNTVASERMRIDSSGKVSINTSSALSTLHVRDAGATSGSLRVGGNGASLGLELLYDQSGATVSTIQANPTYTSDSQLLKIRSDGDRNPNQLVLKGDGSVMIGRASAGSTGNGHTIRGSDSAIFSRDAVGETVQVCRNNNTGDLIQFRRNGGICGEIVNTGSTSVAYNTSSDYRLKENVTDVTDGITRVKQLAPKRFNFIADGTDNVVDGFLAHEAATVVPEAITGAKDAVDEEGNPVYQGIDQAKLVPLITAALQEAIAKIETLEARITTLEAN